MSNPDPTGTGHAVALTIPTHHVAFLRDTIDTCRLGLVGDLAGPSEHFPIPDRARREADAYGRLLAALDKRVIVPDDDVIRVLRELADTIDDSNDYARVVAEHRALCGVLGQIEKGS